MIFWHTHNFHTRPEANAVSWMLNGGQVKWFRDSETQRCPLLSCSDRREIARCYSHLKCGKRKRKWKNNKKPKNNNNNNINYKRHPHLNFCTKCLTWQQSKIRRSRQVFEKESRAEWSWVQLGNSSSKLPKRKSRRSLDWQEQERSCVWERQREGERVWEWVKERRT